MASAAEIGAGNSNYTGNAGIGGGSFGSFQLDTRPIQELAKYTMLYNKSEYDQRQKDAEAAAAEIADMTNYDLNSGIEKDAKLLQEKYDKLQSFIKDNPNALDYRNKEQWAAYKKMRNDLDNDINGGKIRNTMYALRMKEISDEPMQEKKDLLKQRLEKEVSESDIRTPLQHSQKYEDTKIELPTASELSFDVTKKEGNTQVVRNMKFFNMRKARGNSGMFSLGLNETDDLSTEQGKLNAIARKRNPWLQGAEAVNSAINQKDEAGNFVNKIGQPDSATGNTTYKLDKNKLSRIPKNIINLADDFNKYVRETRADIDARYYKDEFNEKNLTFGDGALNRDDYTEINYNDGISPEELALIAQYAQWKGDTYSTKTDQTNELLNAQKLAEDRRQANMSDANADADRNQRRYFHDNPKPNKGNGEKLPDIMQDEPERRVDDFVASYKKTATENGKLELKPGETGPDVPVNLLDDYVVGKLKLKPGETVSMDETTMTVKNKDRKVVRVLSFDGIKSMVSDQMLPTRSGKEEKPKFGGGFNAEDWYNRNKETKK